MLSSTAAARALRIASDFGAPWEATREAAATKAANILKKPVMLRGIVGEGSEVDDERFGNMRGSRSFYIPVRPWERYNKVGIRNGNWPILDLYTAIDGEACRMVTN